MRALPALLTACGPSIPAVPATTEPGPSFVADPEVRAVGSFSLERVQSESTRHGMEMLSAARSTILVRLDLSPDGAVWLCTTFDRLRSTSVSRYASPSGADEHQNLHDLQAMGRGGTATRDGDRLVLTLTKEARSCNPHESYDRDNGQVRCTLGRLDGREALGCEPVPAIGGEGALLPFEPRSVLLGRGGLRASYASVITTLDPPGSEPDPADPRSWTLSWGDGR